MLFLQLSLIFVHIKLAFLLQSDDLCGVVDQTEGLIYGGDQIKQFGSPWSVAIFYDFGDKIHTFICGGTLITRRKVITAAHCLHEKNSNLKNVANLELKLGFYNISNKQEVGSLILKPVNVIVHPEWNPSDDIRYDADIAVMELPFDITITKSIRPICMWERRNGAPQFDKGLIVGWGNSGREQSPHEEIARNITIPVVKNELCFLDEPAFVPISSNRTFCGGAKSGAGPCKGDSGSGLLFSHQNKFYLGGIVSASTFNIFDNCDVFNYAVYTDVFKFLPWLAGRKFNEKPEHELACDSYKGKRPKKPAFVSSEKLTANEAELGEFPHMALIAYNDSITEPKFKCNGVLVSKDFVLTAAHCLNSKSSKAKFVRLGEVNREIKHPDGTLIAVDIKIKKTVTHQQYSTKKKANDIALIELEHSAPLSYFIWPSCLYSNSDDSKKLFLLSGWDSGDLTEDVIKPKNGFFKVPVDEVPIVECKAYSEELGQKLTDHQMCATSSIRSFYLCSGSSGAPTQILAGGSYYVAGITSFGLSCSVQAPSVYTRISAYLDWIEDIVWPEEKTNEKPLVTQFVFPDD